jgi:hypothetical protein
MGRKVLSQDQDMLTVQVVVMMAVFMAIMVVAWPAMIKSLIENKVDIPWMICSSLTMKRRMILTGNLLLAFLRTDGFA